jgi:hypothetical protein
MRQFWDENENPSPEHMERITDITSVTNRLFDNSKTQPNDIHKLSKTLTQEAATMFNVNPHLSRCKQLIKHIVRNLSNTLYIIASKSQYGKLLRDCLVAYGCNFVSLDETTRLQHIQEGTFLQPQQLAHARTQSAHYICEIVDDNGIRLQLKPKELMQIIYTAFQEQNDAYPQLLKLMKRLISKSNFGMQVNFVHDYSLEVYKWFSEFSELTIEEIIDFENSLLTEIVSSTATLPTEQQFLQYISLS